MNTVDQYDIIMRVCQRSEKEIEFIAYDRFTQLMDIELAIEKLNLDIVAVLKADFKDFAHDVVGIHNNIDRQSKTFDNHWTPRHTCA